MNDNEIEQLRNEYEESASKNILQAAYFLGQSDMKQKAVDCLPKAVEIPNKEARDEMTLGELSYWAHIEQMNNFREQTLSALNNL